MSLIKSKGAALGRRRSWAVLAALGSVTAAVSGFVQPANAALAEPALATSVGCPRVIVYFARGSGQPLVSSERGLAPPAVEVLDDLRKRYERSVVESMANPYTAVGLTFSLDTLRLPNLFVARRYFSSVGNGVQVATQNVADLTLLCPSSWLVLGGYSQGAQVTREVLVRLGEPERERVSAVVLFGDPYFSPTEPNVLTLSSFNERQRGLLRQLRAGSPSPVPASFDGEVFSWCHLHDIVCQGRHRGNGWSSHKTYAEDAEEAATRIAGRLAVDGLPPGLATNAVLRAYAVHGTCTSGTCGLAVWSGPGAGSFRAVGAVYEGQHATVACQTRGQTMSASSGRTSAIWDRLANGGFVSDLYLNTPNVGEFSPPLPRCGALSVGTP